MELEMAYGSPKFYNKWDPSEDSKTAYDNVQSGFWTLERFRAWVDQRELEFYRNANANEDL
jgi:uncharacterized HAD superfamily protein